MKNLLLLFLFISQVLTAQTINNGLSAYYPFNGSSDDVSGNENHGTEMGAFRYTNGVICDARQFIRNSGSNEYLTIPNTINLNEYSISFWIKFTDVGVHNSIISLNRFNDWTDSDLWIYTSTKRFAVIQNKQDLRTDNYGHIGYYPKGENFLSSDTLENDTYYNVTLNYIDSVLTIYVDGELYCEYENVDPIPSNEGTGYIGITPHSSLGLHYQLEGNIDELRIYNRILETNEIQEIFNRGAACQQIIYDTIQVYDTIISYINNYLPQDSLVAYYPFIGDANDRSGNENHGTINGATLTTDRFGNENSAFEFDGTNDYIQLPSDFDFPERTVSVWFRSKQYNATQRIYYSDHNGLENSSTTIDLVYNEELEKNTLRFICGGGQAEILTDTIEQNQWYHALITIDTETVKAYINGEFLGKTPFVNHHSVDGFPNAFLACNREKNNYFFGGEIDDLRIYNKSLSDFEIKMLYHEGKSIEEIAESVIVYDTIIHRDTTFYQVYDTIIHHDTAFYQVFDTTFINDTIFVFDTIPVKVYDVITITDTLVIDVVISNIDPLEISTIKVYPNPTKEKVKISLDDQMLNSEYKIRIVNETGSVIFESGNIMVNDYEVNISQFGKKGLYFVQIINPNDIVIDTRKIVLQ